MKIGLFSDTHYCNSENLGMGRMPKRSLERVSEAMEEFKKQGVEACFCLGDLSDAPEGHTKDDAFNSFNTILSVIKSYNIPFYFVPGNHDYLKLTGEDIEKRFGLKKPPYTIESKECSIIVLDANYLSSYECFDKAGVVWYDSNLPPFQIEYLKKELARLDGPVVVMVHECLDSTIADTACIVKNAEAVREVINESKKVKMVIQGHFHKGSENVIDGIPYLILKGMCEGETNPYKIIEI